MANISIDDLSVPGCALLLGEESYLNEINDDEFAVTRGGFTTPVCAVSASIVLSYEFSKMAREVHDKNKGIIAWL
jgi:hypothetical protein